METYRRIRKFNMVREEYLTPVVEVVEVMVEKGYASSPFLENPEEGDEEGM